MSAVAMSTSPTTRTTSPTPAASPTCTPKPAEPEARDCLQDLNHSSLLHTTWPLLASSFEDCQRRSSGREHPFGCRFNRLHHPTTATRQAAAEPHRADTTLERLSPRRVRLLGASAPEAAAPESSDAGRERTDRAASVDDRRRIRSISQRSGSWCGVGNPTRWFRSNSAQTTLPGERCSTPQASATSSTMLSPRPPIAGVSSGILGIAESGSSTSSLNGTSGRGSHARSSPPSAVCLTTFVTSSLVANRTSSAIGSSGSLSNRSTSRRASDAARRSCSNSYRTSGSRPSAAPTTRHPYPDPFANPPSYRCQALGLARHDWTRLGTGTFDPLCRGRSGAAPSRSGTSEFFRTRIADRGRWPSVLYSASTAVLRPRLGALDPHANGRGYSDARWKRPVPDAPPPSSTGTLGRCPRPVFARIRGQSSASSAQSIWRVSTPP